jgi:hypothetical protein
MPAMPAAMPASPAPSTPEPSAASSSRLSLGLLVGFATPINRRPEQVATLGGPSISAGWVGKNAGVWLDYDSYGNTDASHGTVLVSGSFHSAAGDGKLRVGGRAGIGATLVNFDEPAFRDILGTALRAEAIAEYAFADSWVFWLRPLSFDTVIARDLGGPITTWQLRVGVAYRFGLRRDRRATPQPQPQPQPYYPQPYPQPYPPQGYPQQPYYPPPPGQQPYYPPGQQPYYPPGQQPYYPPPQGQQPYNPPPQQQPPPPQQQPAPAPQPAPQQQPTPPPPKKPAKQARRSPQETRS